MLPTSYESLANELIITSTRFGEFVFGETDLVYAPQAPLPYEPANSKKVLADASLALRWTGQGLYDLFQVQVSTDSMFTTTLKDTSLNSSLVWLETVNAGMHEIEFNAMNLTNGIYYYSIQAGEFQDVKKMVLIK